MMRIFIADDEDISGIRNCIEKSKKSFCLQARRRMARWRCR